MTRSSALGLDHAGVLVADVPRALAFYCDVLGLEEVPRPTILKNPGAWLQVGSQQLHLIGEARSGRGRAMNLPYDDEEIATGYGNHVALVVGSLDEMLARIRANGIEPSIPLARRRRAAGVHPRPRRPHRGIDGDRRRGHWRRAAAVRAPGHSA
jgi:glyoxylase I family protein